MISVTPATADDLDDILRMIRALSAFHDDTATVTRAQLMAVFFGPKASATALVARIGEQAIGYAGLHHTVTLHSGVPRIDIHHLYVDHAHRAQGVGRALIAAAHDLGASLGCKGMTIGTAETNKSAQAAYHAMGYAQLDGAGPRFWIPIAD